MPCKKKSRMTGHKGSFYMVGYKRNKRDEISTAIKDIEKEIADNKEPVVSCTEKPGSREFIRTSF
jgi:hypothetical protein